MPPISVLIARWNSRRLRSRRELILCQQLQPDGPFELCFHFAIGAWPVSVALADSLLTLAITQAAEGLVHKLQG